MYLLFSINPRFEQAHRSSFATTVCKTDAAWDKVSHSAGIAWIIEDISRSLDSRGALVHHNVTSALAAEALAIRTAFQTESFLNVTHLRMFSDNQTLIRAINDKFFEKEIYGILKYIESSSSRFVKLSFFYLSRAENGQADALAKFIFRNPNNVMGRPTG